jgi:glycosyltransferase involved in cell wall biosynthesis
VTLVPVPWLSHDDFVRYLYGMDLLLQPSFTETFNNVTADGCACGVPSVVSAAVGWVPQSWMAEPDSALAIANAGCALMRNRNAGLDGWKALDSYNRDARLAWTQWLMA